MFYETFTILDSKRKFGKQKIFKKYQLKFIRTHEISKNSSDTV